MMPGEMVLFSPSGLPMANTFEPVDRAVESAVVRYGKLLPFI